MSLLQALLKKHEALMSDLSAYGSSIQGLKEQAQSCRVGRSPCTPPQPLSHYLHTCSV